MFPRSLRSITALRLMSFCALPLWAQGTWSQTPITGVSPTRAYHAATYDLARQRLVMFGGFDYSGALLDKTWEFDGTEWAPVEALASPSPRGRHAMVYDLRRERVVLFGGTSTVFGASSLADTWEFDGVNWLQRQAAVSPSSRFDHAMAYDVLAGKAVLFGGRSDPFQARGDTWEWDGVTWAMVSEDGPSPRYRHTMAYDLNRDRTVLFGGRDDSLYGDTWEWDGANWQQMESLAAPTPRSGHKMAYDISRNVMVMCGGIPADGVTWEWDGSAWADQGALPRPCTDHVLVYDGRLQRTTLHGGTDVTPSAFFRNEVLTYGHGVAGSFERLGTSCAGSHSIPALFGASSGTGPMMGSTSSVYVTGAWYHAFFVFGWSNFIDGATLLPYDLAPHGMPGCSLQVSRDAIVGAAPTNGIASIQIPVPANPFLVGQVFHIQGLMLDPAANAGGFTTTNHLRATIGRE